MKCQYCNDTGKILLLYSYVDCECVNPSKYFGIHPDTKIECVNPSKRFYSIPKNPIVYDRTKKLTTLPQQIIADVNTDDLRLALTKIRARETEIKEKSKQMSKIITGSIHAEIGSIAPPSVIRNLRCVLDDLVSLGVLKRK